MRHCVIGLVPDLICGFSQKSGIYIFSKALIESLDQLESQARFVLFIPRSEAVNFSHLSSRFTIVRIPRFFTSDFWNIIWHLAVLPCLARYHRVEALHLFAGNRRLSLFPPQRTLATVHDIYHYNQTKLYGLPRFLYFRFVICGLLRRQVNLHAVSASTATDLHQLLGIPTTSIHVIQNVCDRGRFDHRDRDIDRERPLADLVEAAPGSPYFLYVSSLDHPRKNHVVLIRAYERVLQVCPQAPFLVFVGPDFSSSEVIHEAIRRSPAADRLLSLGYVTDQQLGALYRQAFAFVHASSFEGFGYPLVEAMSFGLPVLCSDIPVFREIAGDAPLYFDPRRSENIAAKMLALMSDGTLRERCIATSLQMARSAAQRSNAPLLLDLYHRIAARQHRGAARRGL
jgi:glycosyltransferase involved in cell wall biosynthesis